MADHVSNGGEWELKSVVDARKAKAKAEQLKKKEEEVKEVKEEVKEEVPEKKVTKTRTRTNKK